MAEHRKSRIAALFAGASLAALSFGGSARAAGTTLNAKTGAYTVPGDFDFINVHNSTITTFSNSKVIGDGKGNPESLRYPIGLFVRSDASIANLTNEAAGTISAVDSGSSRA